MDDRQKLEHLAYQSLTEEDCPSTDALADYILGLLTGNDALRVAAHVRACPLCARDVGRCRPAETRRRPLLARMVPLPLAEGRRSIGANINVRRYLAANLAVELTVAPPEGDYWRVTGQVLRAESPVADADVLLQMRRRHYHQHTDALGFFTFEQVGAGRYTLTVSDGEVQVQIRGLALSVDDILGDM